MTGKNGSNNNNYTENVTVTIFFDSLCTLNDLNKITKKYPVAKIICFDYDSYNLLKSNKISYEISDSYLTANDTQKIQKLYYDIYEWYKQPEIKDRLEYSGVNIGQLFSEEIVHLLVKTIKNFVEIKHICKKHAEDKFICPPSLYTIVENFTQNIERFSSTQKESGFVYDEIRYNFQIGNKYFIIKIPRSFYLKIKQLSELFIHLLFGPKTKNDTKKTLLVELNTLRYKTVFSALSNANVETFFFGRRRPAIWNYETYSIIKNSNCKIVTNRLLFDNDVKRSINDGIQIIKPKIQSLWNEKFFTSYFSFEGVSFWKIIEPYFRKLIEKRLNETISEIELTKKLLTKYKFNCILILSEVGFTEQIVVKIANSLKIPVLLHQLGLHWDTSEAREMNKSQGVYPIDSDKFLVWGKVAKNDALKYGVPQEKIQIIGAPRWDNITNLLSNRQNDYILLATSGPQREDINGLLVKNNEQYVDSIKKICEIITRLKKKLVIKLHPSPYELDVTDIVKKINPNISVVTTGDILPLIRSCDIMIMLGLSTAIIEAQLCKKPVLTISPINYNLGHASVLNACVLADMDNFEELLLRLLNDSRFKEEIIAKGTNYVDDCLANQGVASKKLAEYIEKF
jgi:hypothetical protein